MEPADLLGDPGGRHRKRDPSRPPLRGDQVEHHEQRALVAKEPDLFVVGDPNQSVYGWNGADPQLLADLPEVFPGTRVIRLDDNHRCSPAIVSLAAAASERCLGLWLA